MIPGVNAFLRCRKFFQNFQILGNSLCVFFEIFFVRTILMFATSFCYGSVRCHERLLFVLVICQTMINDFEYCVYKFFLLCTTGVNC